MCKARSRVSTCFTVRRQTILLPLIFQIWMTGNETVTNLFYCPWNPDPVYYIFCSYHSDRSIKPLSPHFQQIPYNTLKTSRFVYSADRMQLLRDTNLRCITGLELVNNSPEGAQWCNVIAPCLIWLISKYWLNQTMQSAGKVDINDTASLAIPELKT